MKCFSLLCAVIGIFVCSCSSDTIWDMEAETFRTRLRHGDVDFLRHVEYSEITLEEALLLGPGAGLALSYVFNDLEMDGLSKEMLRLEWEEGTGLWRKHAGEELMERLLEEERYEEVRESAEKYIREFPDRYIGYRDLLLSLYWQHKDNEVLDILEKLKEGFPEKSSTDGELMLIEAVSTSRLEIPGWDDLFVEMFREVPSSGPVIRGYKYINDSEKLRAFFSKEELKFFNARVLTSTGRYSGAAEIYTDLLAEMSSVISSERIYDEIGFVFLALPGEEGTRSAAAEAMLTHAEGGNFFYAYFSPARLFRADGQFERAFELFLEARKSAAGESALGERSLWYALDCLAKQDPAKLVDRLSEFVGFIEDPAYYADLFENAAAELSARRQWDRIWDLYRILVSSGAPDTLALLGHIILEAEKTGLFIVPYDETVPNAEFIQKQIRKHHPYGYYHLLSLFEDRAAGDLPEVLHSLPEGTNDSDENPAHSTAGEFVLSFFDYKLYDRAYRFASEYRGELLNREITTIAENLTEAGLFREAITLVNFGIRRSTWEWRRGHFELLFPKAYAHGIEEAAEINDIEWPVLNALIREESYFDPAALSHAGAMGLSQLMPATAEDTARRMGLAEVDIWEPGTNIAIGAYYFGSLLDRFNAVPAYAVCAYNAGSTRMRRWLSSHASLPPALVLEAIPFTETRNHAKKVLVSTVLYGYLYEGRLPSETIQYYFTGQYQ